KLLQTLSPFPEEVGLVLRVATTAPGNRFWIPQHLQQHVAQPSCRLSVRRLVRIGPPATGFAIGPWGQAECLGENLAGIDFVLQKRVELRAEVVIGVNSLLDFFGAQIDAVATFGDLL